MGEGKSNLSPLSHLAVPLSLSRTVKVSRGFACECIESVHGRCRAGAGLHGVGME